MNTLKNLALLFITLFALMLTFEFVIFRWVLPAADLPVLEADGSPVLRYQPNQTGVYRLQSEIAAVFKINQQGWNSRHFEYQKEKSPEMRRICVVGDSYVEALQVDFDKSFAEKLEDKFKAVGERVEVFRFGVSGAPLSQYLYWIKNEVLDYRPDLIIVNLVHNDFDQSINPPRGTYSKSFAIVKHSEKGFTLTEPVPYEGDLSRLVKKSATFRYLWVREQIRPDTLRDLFDRVRALLRKRPPPRDISFSKTVNTEERSLKKISSTETLIEAATDFLFGEISKVSRGSSIPILLVMDGDRRKGFGDTEINPLNRMVQRLAKSHNLFLLDLSAMFRADYQQNQMDHQFSTDGHWNERSHGLVASSIKAFLDQNAYIWERGAY